MGARAGNPARVFFWQPVLHGHVMKGLFPVNEVVNEAVNEAGHLVSLSIAPRCSSGRDEQSER